MKRQLLSAIASISLISTGISPAFAGGMDHHDHPVVEEHAGNPYPDGNPDGNPGNPGNPNPDGNPESPGNGNPNPPVDPVTPPTTPPVSQAPKFKDQFRSQLGLEVMYNVSDSIAIGPTIGKGFDGGTYYGVAGNIKFSDNLGLRLGVVRSSGGDLHEFTGASANLVWNLNPPKSEVKTITNTVYQDRVVEKEVVREVQVPGPTIYVPTPSRRGGGRN